jgi:hypothetical protein
MPAKKGWVRFRDLPDELVEGMPEHIRATFIAARLHGFEVEMLCSGGRVPRNQRARRRFVLVADDLARSCAGGPLNFDLEALAEDVRAVPRLFVISTAPNAEIYAAAYQSAVEDLKSGHDVALVVETRPTFAQSWARTLSAIQKGGVPTPSKSGRNGHIMRGRLPSA